MAGCIMVSYVGAITRVWPAQETKFVTSSIVICDLHDPLAAGQLHRTAPDPADSQRPFYSIQRLKQRGHPSETVGNLVRRP